MDILGIGPAELMLIILVIILVIGPKDIGKTARSLGRFLNRLYKSDEWRTVTEASRTIRTLPNRLAREAELEELKEIQDTLDDAKKDLVGAKDEIEESTKSIKESQKELSQEVKSIDTEMKSWVAPSSPDEAVADSKPSPEPETSELQISSTEQKQSVEKTNDE